MRFEIINPSDPYTMECDRLDVAAFAVLMLGHGQYALRDTATDETMVPIFMFGGLERWWEENSEESMEGFGDRNAKAIADCLSTVALPDGRERSSLNDIGGEAQRLAAELRGEDVDKEPKTLPVVFTD